MEVHYTIFSTLCMIKLEVIKEESLWLRLKQTQEKKKENILKSDLCYSWEDSHNLIRVRGRLFTLHSYVMGICTISLWYPRFTTLDSTTVNG